MLDVNTFDQLRIGLATADAIRTWSNGEVKKPETINYRTLRPEKDGLFCEKIFGPTRDWECYCGKYKRVRFKGIICERCGVEVTRSKVRRERMGHIELAAPVVHIWYLRGTRSWLAYLLAGIEPREELKAKQLEKVIYFAANLVTWVDDEKRHADLPNLEAELQEELDAVRKETELAIDHRFKEAEEEIARMEGEGAKDSEINARKRATDKDVAALRERGDVELEVVQRAFDEFRDLHARKIIDDELLWRELRDRYSDYFEGGMGADAIKSLIDRIDFDEEERKLRDAIDPGDSGRKPLSAQRKQKAIKRLKIVTAFNRRDEHGRRVNDPRAMILDVVPVIPPELRPMVQLDGGRFATSDLNDLYRRVINRNNRLKRLLDLGAPEIIVNNEKRMLQEAVDALFDNGRRGRPVTGPGNRPLKSLSDMLKGKQGRFRQNLLGKRVDYSGRSVIVVGPTLKLHQCGLPKLMALELFKPFVMKRLVDQELAQNIKSAKRMVERRRPQVWDVLEEVIKEHPVLLNRAPTLHRLGIQAFEPVLVEGKAIQIHPLVCTAFNADFDGDQMAVHLPLSAEAQAESRVLMLSANNILSPASGRPIVTPTQDMVIGAYYLTEQVAGRRVRAVSSATRGRRTAPRGRRPQPARRDPGGRSPQWGRRARRPQDHARSSAVRGGAARRLHRALRPREHGAAQEGHGPRRRAARRALPQGRSRHCPRRHQEPLLPLRRPVGPHDLHRGRARRRPRRRASSTATRRKRTRSRRSSAAASSPTASAARQEVRIWTDGHRQVQEAMERRCGRAFNPIDMMVGSGARGNMMQVRQIAGMRGLVANPRGDMIPRPIKSNFREGLAMLEYFIPTPGARKGLVDTALRTADSGYLTRRLVDVAQELIIRIEDCETTLGIWVDNVVPDTPNQRNYLETKLYGRALLSDLTLSDGTVLAANTILGDPEVDALRSDPGINRVRVRSVLTCDADSASARTATAVRLRPATRSSSARPSASSPPSRSASRARS